MIAGAQHEPAVVRGVVEAVLARDEFEEARTAAEKGLLQRFLEWLADVLEVSPQEAASVLVDVVLAVAVVLVVVLGVVLFLRWRRSRVPAGRAETGARERRVAALLAAARAAEARGDRVGALRGYFAALAVGLGERGDLVYRDAWTNRELVERGRPGPQARALLAPLVPDLDERSYGPVPTTAADVARLRALCAAHLEGGGA